MSNGLTGLGIGPLPTPEEFKKQRERAKARKEISEKKDMMLLGVKPGESREAFTERVIDSFRQAGILKSPASKEEE